MSVRKALEEAQADSCLVSLHSDPEDWGQCSVGYVDLLTEKHVRLRSLTSRGEARGFEIRRLRDVVKVESGDKYLAKVARLAEGAGAVFTEVQPDWASTGDLVTDTLRQALLDGVIVTVWGGDSDDPVVGLVRALTEDCVSLRVVNEYGEDDGISTIPLANVTDIDFATESEQIRQFLRGETLRQEAPTERR